MGYATSNEPPFERGGFQPLPTGVAVGNEPFAGILGQEFQFDDMLWDQAQAGPPPARSGGKVTVRLVRNETGAAVLPQKMCKLDPTNPGLVSALTTAVTDDAYPADEFLPSTGCPDDGMFYVVVEGLAKVILAATVIANISAGDYIGPSGVTAGAVDIQDYTAVPTTGGPSKTYLQTLKAARLKATAAVSSGASSSASTTVLVKK